MKYFFQEGELELTGLWQDKSMNVLMPVMSEVAGANLVITRDSLPEEAELSDYLAVQKKKFRRELLEVKFTEERPCQVENHPAEYWEFSWKMKGTFIAQLMLIVRHGRQILSLAYTAPGGMPEEERQAMRKTLLTFRFRLTEGNETPNGEQIR